MKYYHGTIYSFKDLDLRFATRYMDFGRGIYLSKEEWHAESIALKGNSKHAFVRIYELDMNELRSKFKVKEFKKVSESWVKFVIENRTRFLHSEYDIVIGATADSKTQSIINNFYAYSKNHPVSKKEYKELISRLSVYTYPTQMCILSQPAIDYVNKHIVSIIDKRNLEE